MEIAIDRSSYRRKSSKEKNTPSSNKFKTLVINETAVSLAILIGILAVKLLDIKTSYEWIKNKVSTGLTLQDISNMAKEKYDNVMKKYVIIDTNEKLKAASIINIQLGEGENGFSDVLESKEEKDDINNNESTSNISKEAKEILEKYSIIKPIEGVITSKFGKRNDPNPIVSTEHYGLDIGANTGTAIVASHDGEVIEAGTLGTYGKCVMIKQGELVTVYAHCSKINTKKGNNVKQGEKIAEVGMTGNATGPHLHFEIRYNDMHIDPEEVI